MHRPSVSERAGQQMSGWLFHFGTRGRGDDATSHWLLEDITTLRG
jgi:hypothetical protein